MPEGCENLNCPLHTSCRSPHFRHRDGRVINDPGQGGGASATVRIEYRVRRFYLDFTFEYSSKAQGVSDSALSSTGGFLVRRFSNIYTCRMPSACPKADERKQKRLDLSSSADLQGFEIGSPYRRASKNARPPRHTPHCVPMHAVRTKISRSAEHIWFIKEIPGL